MQHASKLKTEHLILPPICSTVILLQFSVSILYGSMTFMIITLFPNSPQQGVSMFFPLTNCCQRTFTSGALFVPFFPLPGDFFHPVTMKPASKQAGRQAGRAGHGKARQARQAGQASKLGKEASKQATEQPSNRARQQAGKHAGRQASQPAKPSKPSNQQACKQASQPAIKQASQPRR